MTTPKPVVVSPYAVRIASATRCSCGASVEVFHDTYVWCASCPRCLDPAEGASDRAQCYGHGNTPDEALWSWQEQHDEAHEVDWAPTSDVIGNLARDVGFEAERQRGWTSVPELTPRPPFDLECHWYGPDFTQTKEL